MYISTHVRDTPECTSSALFIAGACAAVRFQVWLVRNTKSHSYHAVKLLDSTTDRESQWAARVQHRNIVQYLNVFPRSPIAPGAPCVPRCPQWSSTYVRTCVRTCVRTYIRTYARMCTHPRRTRHRSCASNAAQNGATGPAIFPANGDLRDKCGQRG